MHKFIPKQLWRKLRAEALELEKARRQAEDSRLPRTPLLQKHIANLRILLDRNALLDALPKDAVVAELGVDQGVFTEQILSRATPRKLHLIDSWASERFHTGLKSAIEEKFRDRIAQGSLQIHRGLSTELLPTFAEGYFDWVYIDTDHKYGTTRDELKLAAGKVKPGGLIAGHDYTPGNWVGGLRYGVIEAVREFCVAQGWEFIYQTCEGHGFHSFALRKLPS